MPPDTHPEPEPGARYKASYYTLAVEHGDVLLLFNGTSGGLIRLPRDLAALVRPYLGPTRARCAGEGLQGWQPPAFERAGLPPAFATLFDEFLRGSFFVPAAKDELAGLKERYRWARANSPLLVTITTTLDCNLACYYCYENKAPVYLDRDTCDRILAWVERELGRLERRELYVDWYGGEPLLNQEAIDYLSGRLIALCDAGGVAYSASVVSNGTVWPADAAGFVARNRLDHVQLTLDGPREQHDRRRRYARDGEGRSSYDAIAALVDRLLGALRIYLRINVDPWVGLEALALIDEFVARGWLAPGTGFYPYLAPIGPMTEHCSFLGSGKFQAFQTDFEGLVHEFQRRLGPFVDPDERRHLQYFPVPVEINCAAVTETSVIFGPDGRMYRCGLEVGDAGKAHGSLAPGDGAGGEAEVARPTRWETYDPFADPRCCQCQYLPICMGGCPKSQWEHNEFYLARQSAYWEQNFDRVIRTYYDSTIRSR